MLIIRIIESVDERVRVVAHEFQLINEGGGGVKRGKEVEKTCRENRTRELCDPLRRFFTVGCNLHALVTSRSVQLALGADKAPRMLRLGVC